MNTPENIRYTSSHEWARIESDGSVTIGITDHAQDALGEIVFVELPAVGDKLTASQELGVVESVKAASDIYSPLDGSVTAINEALEDEAGLVNSDPYGAGWFLKLKMRDEADFENLMSADEYNASLHM